MAAHNYASVSDSARHPSPYPRTDPLEYDRTGYDFQQPPDSAQQLPSSSHQQPSHPPRMHQPVAHLHPSPNQQPHQHPQQSFGRSTSHIQTMPQPPQPPPTQPESELKVGKQRAVSQMPQPDVPSSVQSQLAQMSMGSGSHGPMHAPNSPPAGENHRSKPGPKLPYVKIPPYPSHGTSTPSPATPQAAPGTHTPVSASSTMSAALMKATQPHKDVNSPITASSPPQTGESDQFSHPSLHQQASQLSSHQQFQQQQQQQPAARPRARTGSTTMAAASSSSLRHRRFGSETGISGSALTVDQFETARRQAATQPHDPRIQLELARKSLEASDSSASRYTDPTHPSTMEVDLAQQQRNRDAWNTSAIKIAKQLATKAQYPEAMFLLGSIYSSRRYGVTVNYVKALEWYTKAARLDHAESAYRIAVCEEFGVGTQRNVEKAVSWYKRAAMLGNVGSMYKLGMSSMLGSLEQPRDFTTGLGWSNRAVERADAKNPHAVHELASLYEHSPLSTYVAGDPSPRNESKSLESFYTAARLGYSPSQARLGRAFEFGELGCEINAQYSISWYSQAAQQGESDAELAMAGWYWTGAPQVSKKSDTEAFLWAERAAQQGNPRAMYAVGYFYETGTGVSADPTRAKKFYTSSAEKNHPRAVQKLKESY